MDPFLLRARGLGQRRSNFSKKCSSVKGPLWTMASRMKYSAAIMPLMRKNGRKGLRCFKHCFAEMLMKHRESGTDPSCKNVLSGSSREMGRFRGRGTLTAEAGE